MTGRRPTICFVGPLLGSHPGWVTTQAELLSAAFASHYWTTKETSSVISRPLRLIDTVWCLMRWRRRIDVVVLSVYSGPAFVMADLTSLVTKALRVPTVLWLHGGDLPRLQARRPRWVRRVFGRAVDVVAPSRFLAEAMAPAANDPIKVIPNLIDLTALPFHPRTEPRAKLLWMRTLHPLYNPAMAIRALVELQETHPGASLTMAGQEKGLTIELQDLARAEGLSDRIAFTGFLGPDAKTAAFADHDIYLHTNHIDNAPVSVLEAAAAGLPIVATRVGGIPYLFDDGRTALLVGDDDHLAMARAIGRLLDEPGLAASLSSYGRKLAEQSSWSAVEAQWTDVINHLQRASTARS